MPGNTLNGEALHFYDLPWIFRFVLIREKIAAFVFVISGIALQSVLTVSVKSDDYISYISGAAALDDKQIVFIVADALLPLMTPVIILGGVLSGEAVFILALSGAERIPLS